MRKELDKTIQDEASARYTDDGNVEITFPSSWLKKKSERVVASVKSKRDKVEKHIEPGTDVIKEEETEWQLIATTYTIEPPNRRNQSTEQLKPKQLKAGKNKRK